MIIKVMARHADFRGTLGYLINKPRSEEPEILDSNLAGHSADEMAAHTEFDASLRPDIPKPLWHAVISWHRNDRPSDGEMLQATHGLMEKLQIDRERHGFAAVVHKDTDEWHVHVVLNRVSSEGNVWTGENDAKKAQVFRREMDTAFGWTPPDGRGQAEVVAAAISEPASENRNALRGAKHEVHTAVNRAIAASDGTFDGFVATAEKQGTILPSLSYTAKGRFNGASFTLLTPEGEPETSGPRLNLDPGSPPKPYVFKGSQVAWPKDKFEAALLARREQIAALRQSLPMPPMQAAERGVTRQRKSRPPKTPRTTSRGTDANKGGKPRGRKRAPFQTHLQRKWDARRPFVSMLTWKRLRRAARIMDRAAGDQIGDYDSIIPQQGITPRGPSR